VKVKVAAMLAFTKKTGYGLMAMGYLGSLQRDDLASAREISQRFGVSTALLMNVLKELCAAGYVSSVRGVHGGYRLARRPEEITLSDLVTVLEGPVRSAQCLTGDPTAREGTCKIMDRCPVADPIHRLQRKLSDFLKTVTLAEIVEPPTTPAEQGNKVCP
jgi:Rrf2 family protein